MSNLERTTLFAIGAAILFMGGFFFGRLVIGPMIFG